MKKRFIAVALPVILLMTSCSEKAPEIAISNNYSGNGIIVTTETPNTAEIIPDSPLDITTELTTDEGTDISQESAETSVTEDITTKPPVETQKPVETTTTAATTTKPVVTTTKSVVTTKPETTTTTQAPQLPPANYGTNTYRAVNYKEVKGVWISYIELSPILTGKSEAQFTASIKQMYQNCVDLGLNTVYVHARPFGDALYNSSLYPWSRHVTGTVGKAPSFDPLEIMVTQAHAYGLSFQAWINPFRLGTSSEMSQISSSYAIGKWYGDSAKKGDYVVQVDSRWYLNPAYSECIKLVADGAAEIVANYDVDGIHIDDYFYPTTDASFDSKAFSASGQGSLKTFRQGNCDNMVKSLYNAVKSANSTALFGVSTQGNVYNNLNYMYANVEKWCANSGYADYMAPQIYYGFNNSGQPYEKCLKQWQGMASGTGMKIIPGLAVYKIGNVDSFAGAAGKNEWVTETEILKRQILSGRNISNYGGFILYSYAYVFNPSSNVDKISAEIAAVKGII